MQFRAESGSSFIYQRYHSLRPISRYTRMTLEEIPMIVVHTTIRDTNISKEISVPRYLILNGSVIFGNSIHYFEPTIICPLTDHLWKVACLGNRRIAFIVPRNIAALVNRFWASVNMVGQLILVADSEKDDGAILGPLKVVKVRIDFIFPSIFSLFIWASTRLSPRSQD